MYQYFLFDLDGTLTDPKEGITKCVQYALSHFDIHESNLDNLIRFIGPPLSVSFQQYYNLDESATNLAIQKYRERFQDVGIFENGVFEGIQELLSELKGRGKTIALATSKPQVFAERILEKYQLKDYFDVIVGSELDGTRNHKAEVIQEVFSQLQLQENQKLSALMIGDREHDILGANICGIHSLGVRFGYAKEHELEEAGATYIAATVEELAGLLKDF